MTTPIKIFGGRATMDLATRIADDYEEKKLGAMQCLQFSDGEIEPHYDETVRGAKVFIIQSTHSPTDNFMELALMLDAAQRASALEVVAVIPYFGYARQDRKSKSRVSVGAKCMLDMLHTAGADRIVTLDLHADQEQGFVECRYRLDQIFASVLFYEHLKKLELENLVISSCDLGGAKRADYYAKKFKVPLVIVYKVREKDNEVKEIFILGDVQGKNVVIVDDSIDTAGTICEVANEMMKKGAKSVRGCVTHPILSGPAYERIQASALTELFVTDTIPLKQAAPKIQIVSSSELFAKVIADIHMNRSISRNFFTH